MPWSTAGRNQRATASAALVTHVSLHDGDPGATGTNEVSGGGYARLAPSWGSPATGVVDLTAALEFSTPASQTVSHIGFWTAATGGTFLGGFARTSGDAAANAAGEYSVTSAPITAAA